jgi:hypothetical protein
VTIQRVIVLIVVVAAAWFGWRYLFPSDEAQIRSALERIAEAVGSDGEQGEVARIARAASMRNELDPKIVVEAGPPFSGMSGRDTVVAAVARLNGSVPDLEVDLSDVQITVAPDRTTARGSLTVDAHFRDERGERVRDARELDLIFRRLDGDWVVTQVTLVRALTPVTPR